MTAPKNPGQTNVPNVAPNKKILEAEEFVDKDQGIVTFAEGVKDDDIQEIDIESTSIASNDRLALLAFYNEPITIIVSEQQNAHNPEPVVFCSVNGRGAMPDGSPWIPRGVPVVVKRMYVETLARARPSSYDSVERQNAQGEKEIIYPRSTSLRYPFTVVEDHNPKGGPWLRAILSERA